MKNLKISTYPVYNILIGFTSRKLLLNAIDYRALGAIFYYSCRPKEDKLLTSEIRFRYSVLPF